jgi:hypothetical protein
MGLRVRQVLKIAPGLWLNIGKGGISLSLGGRGATVNLGKQGVRGTVGLPGSGLSYSERVPLRGGARPSWIAIAVIVVSLILAGLTLVNPKLIPHVPSLSHLLSQLTK